MDIFQHFVIKRAQKMFGLILLLAINLTTFNLICMEENHPPYTHLQDKTKHEKDKPLKKRKIPGPNQTNDQEDFSDTGSHRPKTPKISKEKNLQKEKNRDEIHQKILQNLSEPLKPTDLQTKATLEDYLQQYDISGIIQRAGESTPKEITFTLFTMNITYAKNTGQLFVQRPKSKKPHAIQNEAVYKAFLALCNNELDRQKNHKLYKQKNVEVNEN